MNHAITVGDVLIALSALIALCIGTLSAILIRNYLSYRRREKAMQNRPYDPQEG